MKPVSGLFANMQRHYSPLTLRWHRILLLLVLGMVVVLLVGPAAPAGANDVYSNIGPAPQLPPGGLVDHYPFANYQLDQYFPGVSVGLFSGVDLSGVPPLIAFCIAQIVWLFTAFWLTRSSRCSRSRSISISWTVMVRPVLVRSHR